ncbi:MAG: TolC family protein [Spirochaetaceae bacterium]|nr:MAG: TolC family protein [Spirochaetaceae bacterium]
MNQRMTAVLLAIAFALSTRAPIEAQTTRISAPERIDLETAIALALQSNLGIESELVALRQKRLVADTWWNRFYPNANATYTLQRSNTAQTMAGQELPRWAMAAGLNLNLDLTLQTFPGYSLAQLDYEMGVLSLEEAKRQVERDVSKLFYDLLLTRERMALVSERIATAQRRYDQARVNFENGLIDEFSLLSAQVALENQRPGLTSLRVAYEQQLLAFRNSLGLPLMAPVEPQGAIDPPDLLIRIETGRGTDSSVSALDQARLRGRLDVQQLEMLNTIQKEQIRAGEYSQGGRAPYLRFAFNYDPTFFGDPWDDDWFDSDLWGQRSGALSVTLVQPLDGWFPYSQRRNETARLESELERNRLNIEQALRGAEIRLRGLMLGIESSRQTIRALEENIALARRAYELAEIGYDNGLRELLEVQNAEVDLKDAEFQLLQEKKNIMDSILDLAFELNVDVDEITTRSGR